MSFSVFEYSAERNGVGVEPANVVTHDVAFGAAHTLAAATRFAAVKANAAMTLAIAASATDAVSGDYQLAAGEARSFPVRHGVGAVLKGEAAS